MDLFCDEQDLSLLLPSPLRIEVASMSDRVLLEDIRVLGNMLKEEKNLIISDYCNGFQSAIKPHMRKIVTDWMVEVTEDQMCQPQVICLAINYMDRFLSNVDIKKNEFQLLACTCLLLSSKFCQVVPISTEQLVLYTDNSISVEDMRQFELKVLNALQWELSTVTSQDFLEHLLLGLDFSPKLSLSSLGRNAKTMSSIASTDYKFLQVKPSVLAAACLAASSQRITKSEDENDQIISSLATKIQETPDSIVQIILHLQSFINHFSSEDQVAPSFEPSFHTISKTSSNGFSTPTDCLEVSSNAVAA